MIAVSAATLLVAAGCNREDMAAEREGQAAARLAEMGYTNVTGLTMGEDGIWRGQAQKDGANVQVAVDFQGNVTP
jgi:hypothetical protein